MKLEDNLDSITKNKNKVCTIDGRVFCTQYEYGREVKRWLSGRPAQAWLVRWESRRPRTLLNFNTAEFSQKINLE